MQKMKKRIAALCAAGIVAVCGVGLAFAADPGSDGDPLISKSYIDNVLLPKIYSYIDGAVSGSGPSDPQGQSEKFEVVNVGAGKKVIAGEGTEMILRMGSGTVIGSMRGGIADTTEGADLADGTAVPSNHLLIVPLADGRGVNVAAEAIFMIKGTYEIQ